MNSAFLFFRDIILIFVILMWIRYYLFLLLSPFYPIKEHLRYIKSMRRRKELRIREPYNPKVSVVIPAWNEEVGVLKTIKSVLYNDYKNTEIIVVNDGSTDRTHELVTKFITDGLKEKLFTKSTIMYIYQENGGKGKALNKGVESSTGEIILTMDSDSALESNAITNLVKYFVDPKIMSVVGNVKVAKNNTIVGMIQKLEYYFGFYFKRAYSILGAEYIFGGACASFRREVFEKIGMFDVSNKTEDIEMSMRTRSAGFECTYAENVVCYTEGAADIKGLVSQRVRWKKGRFDTFWKYKRMFFSANENHNSWLSFFILPYAMLSEVQLLIEPIAISLLITYSIIASDYLSFAIGLLFIFQIYLVTSIFGDKGFKIGKILSFPFTWILFYFLVWIEFLSLVKSITMTIAGEEIEWQDWKRQGIQEEINV